MALSTGKQEFKLVFSLPRSSFVLQPHLNSFVYLVPVIQIALLKTVFEIRDWRGGDGEGIASEFSVSTLWPR